VTDFGASPNHNAFREWLETVKALVTVHPDFFGLPA